MITQLSVKFMVTGQNCTKTKLHEITELREGTILHKHKIARGDKIVRRKFFTKGQFCIKVKKKQKKKLLTLGKGKG